MTASKLKVVAKILSDNKGASGETDQQDALKVILNDKKTTMCFRRLNAYAGINY